MACPHRFDPATRLVLRLHVVWVVGFEPTNLLVPNQALCAN
jgi:hypothetical protein